jgi:uncharacterized protein (DUF4415 family)
MRREYDFSRAKRVSFEGLPPVAEVDRHTKVRVTIMLDYDVLKFFKARATASGAEPYQTQINRALREYMAAGGRPDQQRLLNDKDFVARLAERLATYSAASGPRSQRVPRHGKGRTRPRTPAR